MHKLLGAAALVVVFAAAAGAADTYEAAYKTMQETGKPLVVLIGADWCPACQTMKQSVMPKLESDGTLDDVAFAIVDTDRQGELARSMMRGNSIPQLVMYIKTDDGWKLQRLVGGQSTSAVQRFVANATKESPKVAANSPRE